MDIRFSCGNCGQHIAAPEEVAKTTVNCPTCGHSLLVPSVSTTSSAAQREAPQTKRCPFCAEEILQSATKCKHCGELLDSSRLPKTPSPSVVSTKPQVLSPKPQKKEKSVWMGCLLAFLFFMLIFIGVPVLSNCGKGGNSGGDKETGHTIPYKVLKNMSVLSNYDKDDNDVGAKRAGSTISYQILKKWNGGMHILVSETASRNEVMNLAENLRREDGGKSFVIDIFDSHETWQSRESGNEAYPEKEFWRHYLVQIGGGRSDGQKIHWVAEGRDH